MSRRREFVSSIQRAAASPQPSPLRGEGADGESSPAVSLWGKYPSRRMRIYPARGAREVRRGRARKIRGISTRALRAPAVLNVVGLECHPHSLVAPLISHVPPY